MVAIIALFGGSLSVDGLLLTGWAVVYKVIFLLVCPPNDPLLIELRDRDEKRHLPVVMLWFQTTKQCIGLSGSNSSHSCTVVSHTVSPFFAHSSLLYFSHFSGFLTITDPVVEEMITERERISNLRGVYCEENSPKTLRRTIRESLQAMVDDLSL